VPATGQYRRRTRAHRASARRRPAVAAGSLLRRGHHRSPAMVTERLPWSEEAAEWLRQAMAIKLPLFGVCYGHQLLAYALGGEV
ncbi:glutamine amidotransferase-related protein, partial [Klebsiella variicola]|uniref:glutamine amidotransferase-related protein n=1 Tax=Klebsiella variicola TaxID=244366 RepID=UPI003F6721DF